MSEPEIEVWDHRPLSAAALRARFRGCLLGAACGDALGAPVEFLSRDNIIGTCGPEGIGARSGAKAIPRAWLSHLELKDVITETADDLLAFPGWEMSDDAGAKSAAIVEKYPGF